jgi:hypothetical protein
MDSNMVPEFSLADRVAITMPAHQWNDCLEVLMDGRYRVVAPLIASILSQSEQFRAQRAMQAIMPEAFGGIGPNGEAVDDPKDARSEPLGI